MFCVDFRRESRQPPRIAHVRQVIFIPSFFLLEKNDSGIGAGTLIGLVLASKLALGLEGNTVASRPRTELTRDEPG